MSPYVTHLRNYSNSLLPKFCGAYRLRSFRGELVRIVIMDNLFCTEDAIHTVIDLKGSTKRRASASESNRRILTDVELRQAHMTLRFVNQTRADLLQQIALDVNFLRSCGLFDYSVLIGAHLKSFEDKRQRQVQIGSSVVRSWFIPTLLYLTMKGLGGWVRQVFYRHRRHPFSMGRSGGGEKLGRTKRAREWCFVPTPCVLWGQIDGVYS